MKDVPTIALDTMGGDHGPDVVIPAALLALKELGDIRLILVGNQDTVQQALNEAKAMPNERLQIFHATQVVKMDEPPSRALRYKKDSSMRVAINLVKEGKADACVSAGNTGALMATARYVLKTLPGIDRPAIISAMPTRVGHTQMLDLGANVDTTARHLLQFAVMGSVLATAVDNIERPKVALLNIGEEEIKGNEVVKEAARLLQASGLNYVGYIEGTDVYSGGADVVVCDGFVGNVALKTSEGVAQIISHFLKSEFRRNWYSRFAALVARPVLEAFRAKIDPRLYNGASLLGLRGIVIKSHGGADSIAFANAIKIAAIEVQNAIPQRTHSVLDAMLLERQAV